MQSVLLPSRYHLSRLHCTIQMPPLLEVFVEALSIIHLGIERKEPHSIRRNSQAPGPLKLRRRKKGKVPD